MRQSGFLFFHSRKIGGRLKENANMYFEADQERTGEAIKNHLSPPFYYTVKRAVGAINTYPLVFQKTSRNKKTTAFNE